MNDLYDSGNYRIMTRRDKLWISNVVMTHKQTGVCDQHQMLISSSSDEFLNWPAGGVGGEDMCDATHITTDPSEMITTSLTDQTHSLDPVFPIVQTGPGSLRDNVM